MTTVLAFDTSSGACSAAVVRDGALLADRFEVRARGQAEVLLPMVGDVMADAGLQYDNLDLIATTVGPGSFTGMRIGLAAARSMALAADLPALGLTTLEVVAEAVGSASARDRPLVVCIESKREDVYAQIFGLDETPLSAPLAALPTQIAEMPELTHGAVLAGSAAKRMAESMQRLKLPYDIASVAAEPQAKVVAALAARRWQPGEQPDPLAPLYLRPPDTTGPN